MRCYGVVDGAMTGTLKSAFTLAYKREVGVETENADSLFSTAKVNAIKKNNGNIYINRGSYYNVFEDGTMADGTWFDEMIFLDKYKNDMQLAIMDVLYQNNKVAQTESGMTRLKDALKVVCEDMNNVGFISGWCVEVRRYLRIVLWRYITKRIYDTVTAH